MKKIIIALLLTCFSASAHADLLGRKDNLEVAGNVTGSDKLLPIKCGNYKKGVSQIKEKYKEVRTNTAVTPAGYLEVYSIENGTFTIILKMGPDVACLIMSGDEWQTKKINVSPK